MQYTGIRGRLLRLALFFAVVASLASPFTPSPVSACGGSSGGAGHCGD